MVPDRKAEQIVTLIWCLLLVVVVIGVCRSC
jgi:hypothetical protein